MIPATGKAQPYDEPHGVRRIWFRAVEWMTHGRIACCGGGGRLDGYAKGTKIFRPTIRTAADAGGLLC